MGPDMFYEECEGCEGLGYIITPWDCADCGQCDGTGMILHECKEEE